MINFNILTQGFVTANGRGFLYPLFFNSQRLKKIGININFFTLIKKGIFDCDVLGIESKFFKKNPDSTFPFLEKAREKIERIIWFDTTDSSSWGRFDLLPHLDAYYKLQILKDKNMYLKPLHKNRLWIEYYFNNFGVEGDDLEKFRVVKDESQLNKIKIAWGPGLADYSLHSLLKNSFLRFSPVYLKKRLLICSKKFTSVYKKRRGNISCRIGFGYDSRVISFQRRQIKDILQEMNVNVDKISRKNYFKEIQNAKIVLSPFGWGEVTLRDFEVFLSGAILFKPDMSHMQTWPDFYRENKTVVFLKWDFSDFDEKINTILDNYKDYAFIAQNAQDIYRKYIISEEGHEEFCQRVKNICWGNNGH